MWFNGHKVGEIRGAFERGVFDVTALVRPGVNALAVRVAPPPHPGIPAEQSIKDGPGYDGGVMLIDGPTFVDTEGWDWMPAIRDRDTGIWQSVSLEETGPVTLGDPQVITHLPLPDISTADIDISAPVHNDGNVPRTVVLKATFEGVQVHTTATVPPGDTTLHLTPDHFGALHLLRPRLWWPMVMATRIYIICTSRSRLAAQLRMNALSPSACAKSRMSSRSSITRDTSAVWR